MLRKLITSAGEAFSNIKANFFHTLLSVLGIVIGVSALVAILSLIDGMEEFAHEQISKTTTLESVIIQNDIYSTVDGVRMKKDSFAIIDYPQFVNLSKAITVPNTRSFIQSTQVGKVKLLSNDSIRGCRIVFVSEANRPDTDLVEGRWFETNDIVDKKQVAVITKNLADNLKKDKIIGQPLEYKERVLEVVGIVNDKDNLSKVFAPISLLSAEELKNQTPTIAFLASSVELVPEIKKQSTDWLKAQYGDGADDFRVITNEMRVAQANKGFLLFRIVMGLIVGISVIVGGIGVMNVLIISVTERTKEIGVRKAVGAKRFDILVQFIAESITISAFGSFLGLILGVLGTLAIVPIIKAITEAPFQAAFTGNTLLVISIVALLVGVIFGTYPALKASKLDPVEAIRHE